MSLEADLLYGVYEKLDGGGLLLKPTGQSLILRQVDERRGVFNYADGDVRLSIPFELTAQSKFGDELLIGWKQDDLYGWMKNDRDDYDVEPLRRNYGLWRRVSWFLLDAGMVWLENEQKRQSVVIIRGGWRNGGWRDGVALQSYYMRHGGAHRDRLMEPLAHYSIFPLNATAPRWRYEPGLAGKREARIALLPSEVGELIADLTVPPDVQLAEVPRFVGSDGSIFFFHRVVPHVGPDYAPGMDYGLVSAHHVHYFHSSTGTLCGKPIKLRRDAPVGTCIEAGQDNSFPWSPDRPPVPRIRLHPVLREAQFFAGLEAEGQFQTLRDDQRPVMTSLDHDDQNMNFGYYLGQITEAPTAVGLPFTKLICRPG